MEINGIHVEFHGPEEDSPIVLVHGAPDSSATFRSVLAHLPDRRMVTYDRRGYGRSVGAAPPTGMIDHARDLLAILDHLGVAAVVVAHSFGSNPTMLAASLEPEAFTVLGLWEPPLVWTELWPQGTKDYNRRAAASDDPEGLVERVYRNVLGETRWAQLSPEARTRRRAEGVAFQVDMASELVSPFRFEDVVSPALVGYGTETGEDHLAGARWLAVSLPNARLHGVEGVGHFVPHSHPSEFASFVSVTSELVTEWGKDFARGT